MNNEVLTLVRELEILRDTNLKLTTKIEKLKEREKGNKAYKTLIYKMVKFMFFLSNGHNEKIAASAQYYLDENARIRLENGENELTFTKVLVKTNTQPETDSNE